MIIRTEKAVEQLAAGGLFNIYELLPAFIVALAAIVVVSLLDKKPSQEIIDEFESVNAAE